MNTEQTKETIKQLLEMNESSLRLAENECVRRDIEIEFFEALEKKAANQLLVLKNERPQTAATVQGHVSVNFEKEN